jgi:hypothetical protein
MSILAIGLGSTPTVYREGKISVVPSGSSLPPNCVKCGIPVSGNPLTKTFRWHNPWLVLLIFVGLIVYAIVALVVQKKVRIAVPFCEAHRRWRTQMNLAGALLLIGSVPMSILLGIADLNGRIGALVAIGMAFRPIGLGPRG